MLVKVHFSHEKEVVSDKKMIGAGGIKVYSKLSNALKNSLNAAIKCWVDENSAGIWK